MTAPERHWLLHYFNVVDRWLGRIHLAIATTLLAAVAVAGAMLFSLLFSRLFEVPLGYPQLGIAALVTVAVGVPIILYAQQVIRSQRAAKHQLKMMTRELAIALHNAEDVNNSRAAQFANMSHELRTPMNAIVGFSDILRHERFGPMGNPRYVEFAGDINDSAQHLLELINNLLDLAKMEAGGFDTRDAELTETGDTIERIVRLIRPLAARQGVTVTVEAAGQDLYIVVVERMLRQILINLVSNAIKFTPRGGLVAISAQRSDTGEVAISVTDNGIGMSAEEIRVAFMPFGQVNSLLSRKHAGTGLGLPLAKAMVELNNGRLELRSEPGAGTRVMLFFPAADPDLVFPSGGPGAAQQPVQAQ